MTHDPAPFLAAAILSVLSAATVIGEVIKRVKSPGRPHAVIDNLNTRIRSWWVIAALLGAALWLGTLATFALFAVVSLLALREYLRPSPRPASIGRWVSGVGLCIVCIAYIPALLTLDIPGYEDRNAFLLLFLVLISQGSDVLQYIWGKLCGRRSIAPTISPSKTVEGFVGGVASATVLGTSLWWITPFSMGEAALVSLAIALTGFASALVLSAEKRARGIKDWGRLVRGHGGVLDRIDSLWLAAPLFFYFTKLGWTGG